MAGRKATRGKDWGLKLNEQTGIFDVDLSINGRRIRCSTFTSDREQARHKRDVEARRAWTTEVAGEAPPITWEEASYEWLEHIERQGNKTIEDARDKLRWLRPYLGELPLSAIDDGMVSQVLAIKRKQGNGRTKRPKPLSSATLNRYYAVITAVFRFQILKGRASHCPRFIEMVREPAGDEREVRWLRPEQWEQLRDELPPHLRQMARFALATGLRQHNVTHLEWARVDLTRRLAWIPGGSAKAGRNLQVPLNSEALAVLLEQQEAPNYHERWVFPFSYLNNAGPIRKPAGAAWQKAKARAGVDPAFRWHDLRHTWATWHVMNGTKLEALMKLGGWHSYEMVLTYAHQAEGYLAHVAENAVKVAPLRQDPVTRKIGAAHQSARAVDVFAEAS